MKATHKLQELGCFESENENQYITLQNLSFSFCYMFDVSCTKPRGSSRGFPLLKANGNPTILQISSTTESVVFPFESRCNKLSAVQELHSLEEETNVVSDMSPKIL